MSEIAARTRCRALVAGFGGPGMRDLDFGRQLVRYLEGLDWPEGVVVEDLSYSAPLVLHRLQELEPAKVVLVGATARGLDPPGVVRRYRPCPTSPSPHEVQRSLEESVQGLVDIDHTLAVARHWGGLPAETVVIEVEPADCSFGLGFSEQLGAAFDLIVATVLDAVGATADEVTHTFDDLPLTMEADPPASALPAVPVIGEVEASEELLALARYADTHKLVRTLHSHRGKPLAQGSFDGLRVAGRSRRWSVNVDAGSDGYDLIPLDDGWLGLVVADVGGRGVEAAVVMADLRIAVRAYAVLEGTSPVRLVNLLDRLAVRTGTGDGATLIYAALRPSTGELRLTNAGSCPPLVVAGAQGARFLDGAPSEPLGSISAARSETTLHLAAGATLVLFTDGLLDGGGLATDESFERIRRAASNPYGTVDDLCDQLLDDSIRREDDISLLAVRMPLVHP
jgi:hydrogenase maturation protease